MAMWIPSAVWITYRKQQNSSNIFKEVAGSRSLADNFEKYLRMLSSSLQVVVSSYTLSTNYEHFNTYTKSQGP